MLSKFAMFGFLKSQSTKTTFAPVCAKDMARFRQFVLFPSPASALVTIIFFAPSCVTEKTTFVRSALYASLTWNGLLSLRTFARFTISGVFVLGETFPVIFPETFLNADIIPAIYDAPSR